MLKSTVLANEALLYYYRENYCVVSRTTAFYRAMLFLSFKIMQ